MRLLVPPGPSGDVLTPLSVPLGAGDYALIVGGAGLAVFRCQRDVMPQNNVASLTRLRFSVDGELEPSAPRPPTGLRVS